MRLNSQTPERTVDSHIADWIEIEHHKNVSQADSPKNWIMKVGRFMDSDEHCAEQECSQICRINPEETADEKIPPVAALLVKAQMNAKPADDKKDWHSDLTEAEWEKI